MTISNDVKIDKNRFVYFGTIKNPEFYDKIISRLIRYGFAENCIVKESVSKFAHEGDYIAQPWFPDEPTELIIGVIKKAQTIEPQRRGDGQLDAVEYDTLARIPF